jgi:hypothetical protein
VTIRAPEKNSFVNWALEGLNLKTIVLYTIALCGSYYSLSSKQASADTRMHDIERRQDKQSDTLKGKVEKDSLDIALQGIRAELSAISESQGRMETILMEQRDK